MDRPRDTKERILDVAERLFADHGFAATSLRAITKAAGVNLAAVHYHFGSKEGLFQAVFARRLAPINAERLALLDAAEARAADRALNPEEILEAFLVPAIRRLRTEGGPCFLRLAGRIYTEPGEHWKPVAAQFDEVKTRFVEALGEALPHLSRNDLFWRMHFVVGVLCHTLADHHRLELLSDGRCDPDDVESLVSQLVPFCAAGLRAATPTPPSPARTRGSTR